MANSHYQIVNAAQLWQLQDAIRAYMADGWEPLGSPFREESKNQWCQAMTRGEQPEPGKVRLKEPKR